MAGDRGVARSPKPRSKGQVRFKSHAFGGTRVPAALPLGTAVCASRALGLTSGGERLDGELLGIGMMLLGRLLRLKERKGTLPERGGISLSSLPRSLGAPPEAMLASRRLSAAALDSRRGRPAHERAPTPPLPPYSTFRILHDIKGWNECGPPKEGDFTSVSASPVIAAFLVDQ